VHFVPDQLSHAKNGEPNVSVEDQLFDATFFILIGNWYTPIKEYIRKGYFKYDVPPKARKHLTIKSIPYTLYGENLYKLGPDGILQQCFWHLLTLFVSSSSPLFVLQKSPFKTIPSHIIMIQSNKNSKFKLTKFFD
jgi:hypothetical protein